MREHSVLHLLGALQFSKHFHIYDPVLLLLFNRLVVTDSL